MTDNDTSADSMFRHVTVTRPARLPVLLPGSRNALLPAADDGQNSSAVIIIVLSVVVLAAIFFTVCGLLVKSQALAMT